MKHNFNTKHVIAEQAHWFLLARRALLCGYFSRLSRSMRILEVGCSSGMLIDDLTVLGFHDSYGVDINKEAIEYGKQRGVTNISLVDGVTLPYPDNAFDFVISSDVLEHISDEGRALAEWRRVLRPGGRLLIMVPAFQFLWSEHDVVNEHFRRYTRTSLTQVLHTNALDVVRATYWNFFLFIPVVIFRLFNNIIGKFASSLHEPNDQLFDFGSTINGLLKKLLSTENYLILQGVNFPFGVSVFIESKK